MENNNPPVPPNPNDDEFNKQFNEQFGNMNPPQQKFEQQNFQNQNFQNQNFQQTQNQPNFNYNQPLAPVPNASTSLVLGIVGLVLSIIWCYWVAAGIGLILSIVALIIGSNSVKTYNENPEAYAPNSVGNARAGKVMGIIGTIIAILWFLGLVVVFVFIGSIGRLF